MRNRVGIFVLLAIGMTMTIVAVPLQTGNQTGSAPKEPAMTVTCKADPERIGNDAEAPIVTITANVEQKEESPLTYTWSITGGAKIVGSDSVVTVDVSDLKPGFYIAKVKIDDEKKNSVTCRATFNRIAGATKPPKQNGDCATLILQAEPQVIEPGANATVNLRVVNNGQTDEKVTYKWSADKGEIKGEGDTVSLDTSNVDSGNIKVTVTTTIGNCPLNATTTIAKKPSGN